MLTSIPLNSYEKCNYPNLLTPQKKVVLLKPSGQVMLEEVIHQLKIKKTLTCPVTGKMLKDESDILKLVEGYTGFSAHNEIEAKRFNLTRGDYQEAADRAGSLGAKGTVFR